MCTDGLAIYGHLANLYDAPVIGVPRMSVLYVHDLNRVTTPRTNPPCIREIIS